MVETTMGPHTQKLKKYMCLKVKFGQIPVFLAQSLATNLRVALLSQVQE